MKTQIAILFAHYIRKKNQNWIKNPIQQQNKTFNKLISKAKNTEFGRYHDFKQIKSYNDFKKNVPVRDYEGLKDYIDQVVNGQKNILWPGKPLYFAKTSGTTSGTKFIPITRSSIKTHIRSARDALLNYFLKSMNYKSINGKHMFLQGSPELIKKNGIYIGRLSGISAHYIPKLFLQNVHFCFKFLVVSILAPILIRRGNRVPGKKRFFVTRFPGRLSTNEKEQKYNNIVRPQDYFLASLLTDGLHQNLSLAGWVENASNSNKLKQTEILDRYFSPLDSFLCLFKTAQLIRRIRKNKAQYFYKNISFTEIIKEECAISSLRTARLITISRGFVKLFLSIEQHNQQSSVIYYLHEYAYGRMITTILKRFCPTLKRIGFQHGPSAKTKLVYMLSELDLVEETQSLALPQAVLAEDSNSAKLYKSSGYKKVSTLSSIPRIASSGNHKFRQEDRELNTSLIATGLHDGLVVMTLMLPVIRNKKDVTFLVKLHPKANNKGALAVKLPPNCFFVNEPIEDLFKRVDMVYSSYSSVGIEAETAGIPVTFIESPGRVSQKPTSRSK